MRRLALIAVLTLVGAVELALAGLDALRRLVYQKPQGGQMDRPASLSEGQAAVRLLKAARTPDEIEAALDQMKSIAARGWDLDPRIKRLLEEETPCPTAPKPQPSSAAPPPPSTPR